MLYLADPFKKRVTTVGILVQLTWGTVDAKIAMWASIRVISIASIANATCVGSFAPACRMRQARRTT